MFKIIATNLKEEKDVLEEEKIYLFKHNVRHNIYKKLCLMKSSELVGSETRHVSDLILDLLLF